MAHQGNSLLVPPPHSTQAQQDPQLGTGSFVLTHGRGNGLDSFQELGVGSLGLSKAEIQLLSPPGTLY